LASAAERPLPVEPRLGYNRSQPVALLPGPLPATVLAQEGGAPVTWL